ncbi:protein FAM168A isoform X2 [Numida meleagris]|uniref:protein FAM168A isoform X2 n=1 Tax=Numida meleagris TaxID=8996 RepID=UPI000B3D9DF6|nr:protein FAM168A isoform X2 [Numida meleagris]XP_021239795.1 protein FAM168A isoform X2 [Numida meleagris]XP_021239796.1 protein FAM168A isoform X2 [Numida meleagris]XP_021239797.1 protein FAM168A isoform X2 [Numida meleagris]XP_021239798.1 protein FAM168A isoform X2 [Numida meleagris]
MNPVYSPVQPGAPYGNPKNMAYTGYPTGYPTAAPAYNPNMYPTSSPGYAPACVALCQCFSCTSAANLRQTCWLEVMIHYTSDEASLASDLLLLCHRGHLPPPGGHWDREQNLPGFFCSIQVHCGDSLQGPTDPEQQRASSLLSVSESVPNRYVPHQKCLPTAEPVHPGSLLYPASVRGTASRYPSHHRGSAQQHPVGHLPGPCRCAPDQRRGHGDGRWHHHGHVSRNLVDHPTTHRHRSTSSFCANVPGSRNPHLQLRTAALVKPTGQVISEVKHCMQLHKSYIGAAATGLQHLVCLQEQKKKVQGSLYAFFSGFCKSCFF